MTETPYIVSLERQMHEKHLQTPLLSDDLRRSYKIRTPDETYQIIKEILTEGYRRGELSDFVFNLGLETLRAYKKTSEQVRRHSAFGIIEDIRMSFRTRLTDPEDHSNAVYTIEDVLIVIFWASMCNNSTCEDIAEFYAKHLVELLFFFPTLPAPPMMLSPGTIRNVLQFLNIDDAESFFTTTFGQVRAEFEKLLHCDKTRQQLIHPDQGSLFFDGQVPGSSSKRKGPDRKTKACKIEGFFNNGLQECCDITDMDEQNNEAAALARLLRAANIEDGIVMADALNATCTNMQIILNHGANYLLPIKNNLGNEDAVSACADAFNKAPDKDSSLTLRNETTGFKKCGSKIQCHVHILDANKALKGTCHLKKYPGLRTIVHYTSTVIKTNGKKAQKNSSLEMFFLSSLPFGDNEQETDKTLEQITRCILKRWNSEDSIQENFDYTFRQDEQIFDVNFVTDNSPVKKTVHNMISWCRQRFTRIRRLKTTLSYANTMARLEANIFDLYTWFIEYWMEEINLKDKDNPPKRTRGRRTGT